MLFFPEFVVKDEDGAGKNPVSKTVKLDLEMEKRNVTENTIACEILEAEVRMEVMMEKQKMGMSIDCCFILGFLGFQDGCLLQQYLLM